MRHTHLPLQHFRTSPRPLRSGRSYQPRLLSFFHAVQVYETVCYRTINKSNGSARAMDGTILKVTITPRPGFGCVIMLQSKLAPTQPIFQLTVSTLPKCNCPAFKDMISKFGRKQNLFLHCKHLYFIFVKVSNADPKVDLFIHAPTFSFNDLKLILEGGLLTQSTS